MQAVEFLYAYSNSKLQTTHAPHLNLNPEDWCSEIWAKSFIHCNTSHCSPCPSDLKPFGAQACMFHPTCNNLKFIWDWWFLTLSCMYKFSSYPSCNFGHTHACYVIKTEGCDMVCLYVHAVVVGAITCSGAKTCDQFTLWQSLMWFLSPRQVQQNWMWLLAH